MTWQDTTQQVYLYILLEFQSSVDYTMPIRLMHYVACFYDHLLKEKSTSPGQGFPPEFLRPYQPHLRYYLVDEGAYSEAELHRRQTALSGVFEIEQASSREALQAAVGRIVRVIESDPRKQRLDKVITRWLKRHLSRMGADVNLDRMNSLVEDRGMLAENLRHWAEKERIQGREEGRLEIARNLIVRTQMDDQMIAEIAGLTIEQVAELRAEGSH